jgi:hypothetical protein
MLVSLALVEPKSRKCSAGRGRESASCSDGDDLDDTPSIFVTSGTQNLVDLLVGETEEERAANDGNGSSDGGFDDEMESDDAFLEEAETGFAQEE